MRKNSAVTASRPEDETGKPQEAMGISALRMKTGQFPSP